MNLGFNGLKLNVKTQTRWRFWAENWDLHQIYRSFNDDQPMYLGGALFLDNPIRHSIRSPARKELVFFLRQARSKTLARSTCQMIRIHSTACLQCFTWPVSINIDSYLTFHDIVSIFSPAIKCKLCMPLFSLDGCRIITRKLTISSFNLLDLATIFKENST